MNNIKFILTLSLSLIISLNLYSQSKKELREAREAAVAAKVDSIIKAQHLTIEIDRISPMSGRSFSSLDGYTLTKNKEDRYSLSFVCKTQNSHERCDFYIEIMDNGSSSIRLTLTSRDPISYYGEIQGIDN